ncbi:hypothetical protein SH501x_001016 [Pirellulaceae bacterium SH501]
MAAIEPNRSNSLSDRSRLVFILCAIALAIHAPSLALFLVEPSLSSDMASAVGFFSFSMRDYLRYLINQSDVIATACLTLSCVIAFSKTPNTRDILIVGWLVYLPIASALYAVRCLGGFGGLWV